MQDISENAAKTGFFSKKMGQKQAFCLLEKDKPEEITLTYNLSQIPL